MEQDLYPVNGRIGRFIKIVRADPDSSVYAPLLKESHTYESLSPIDKSLWWKKTIENMEKSIGYGAVSAVMAKCGAKCCGAGQRKTARRLFLESGSIAEFLKRISTHDMNEGDLSYTSIGDTTIIAEHH